MKARFNALGKTVQAGVGELEKEMEKLHQKNILAILDGKDDVSVLLEKCSQALRGKPTFS